MWGKIKIKGVTYELTGDPEFEDGFAYVTLIREDEAVFIAKYKAVGDDELPNNLSFPIENVMVADADE